MTILVFTLPLECKQALEQNLLMGNHREAPAPSSSTSTPKEQLHPKNHPQIKLFCLRLLQKSTYKYNKSWFEQKYDPELLPPPQKRQNQHLLLGEEKCRGLSILFGNKCNSVKVYIFLGYHKLRIIRCPVCLHLPNLRLQDC